MAFCCARSQNFFWFGLWASPSLPYHILRSLALLRSPDETKMVPKTTSRDCFSGKKLVDLGNFGIALLAMCDTKNADFAMQIGDFSRNLWQFWLVFRVILSITANFVNISVENPSVEKATMARRSCNNSNQ